VVLRRRLTVLLAAVMLLAMTLASSSLAFANHNAKGFGQHEVVETLPTRTTATTTLMAAEGRTTPTSASPVSSG
jgi:hypothetical protein